MREKRDLPVPINSNEINIVKHTNKLNNNGFLGSSSSSSSNGGSTEIPLEMSYLLKVLYKYKWSIILIVVMAVSSIWLLLNRVQPMYEASATIQIDPEKWSVLDEKGSFYQNWMDPEYFNTQLSLLTNPSLMKQVVVSLDLMNEPNFLSERPTTLTGAFFDLLKNPSSIGNNKKVIKEKKPEAIPDATAKPDADKKPGGDPSEDMYEGLSYHLASIIQVMPIPKTRLVVIKIRHHDPKIAQKVVTEVAQAFINNNLARRTGAKQETTTFLQKRLAELQSEIHTAEEQLADYSKKHEIISLKEEENPVMERLATLNRQVLEAEASRKDVESIHKLIKDGTTADAVPEVQQSSIITGLQSKLSDLKQKRAELLTTYTEDWPGVKQAEQTIKQIEKDIQAEKVKIINGIETRYLAAKERERLLRADLDKQMGTTIKQNESAINYRIKQQEIDTKRELSKTLLSQLKENEIAGSSKNNNISFITPAVMPKYRVSPQVTWTLTMTFFFATLGGFGVALIRDYLNTRIRSIEDVDRFVNLPTLGAIPELRNELIDRILPNTRALNGEAVEEEMEGNNTALTPLNQPQSLMAEAYRHLRTSIILSPVGQSKRMILVTSGQPGEGKTTTSLNIAISLAQTGARTVLIDADLRKPSVAHYFNIEVKSGLSQYLSGYIPLDSLIINSGVNNLELVPSGGSRPLYPSELLGSNRMNELLQYLSETRDYVIVDSPPILPFADALILSAQVDGVLLVVNAQKSRREIVQRANRILREVGANLLGVVLNSVNHVENSNYGYGYNYYRSRYNQDAGDTIIQRTISALKDITGGNGRRDKKGIKIDVEDIVTSNGNGNGNGFPSQNVTKPLDSQPLKKSGVVVVDEVAKATSPLRDLTGSTNGQREKDNSISGNLKVEVEDTMNNNGHTSYQSSNATNDQPISKNGAAVIDEIIDTGKVTDNLNYASDKQRNKNSNGHHS